MSIMTCNEAGKALIKQFEGCRLQAYADQGGVPTIGYGATGSDIHLGMIWNQNQADERFLDDLLIKAETPINRLVFDSITLNSNQFSALCSLVFNIGSGHFASSSALRLINENRLSEVPDHMLMWDEVSGRIDFGLLRRRQVEVALWEEIC